jgi:predicted AAA+ superfamily ATPase
VGAEREPRGSREGAERGPRGGRREGAESEPREPRAESARAESSSRKETARSNRNDRSPPLPRTCNFYIWTHDDKERRRSYLRDAILEPVITRDIFQNATVKKPALFRQAFELVCLHAGEVLSLNKFLGQLQEGGNVDLVKHYLSLYQKAFLIKTLEKFSTNKIQKKGSSPKLIPLAPAFMSLFGDADKGRKFELMIGLELLKKYEDVFYWREGNAEVDFVIKHKKKIIGIEVKSGNKRGTRGLEIFGSTFKAKTLLITLENFERLHDLIEAL